MTLNTRIGDVPPFQCYVRKQFLRAEQDSVGDWVEAIVIGAVLRKDMALGFTVLLESGALWYDVPIHALSLQAGVPWTELRICQMWDCLSDQWSAHRYDHLRYLAVKVRLNNYCQTVADADYLFTIEMLNSFYADDPSEHKTFNILALTTGQIVAYPNNRCQFVDKTFTKLKQTMDYIRTHRHYFAEE